MDFLLGEVEKLIPIMKVASALATSQLFHSSCFGPTEETVPNKKWSLISCCFSLHSLDKITYHSSGQYECVFMTDPQVMNTIEVKSMLTKLQISFKHFLNLSMSSFYENSVFL